MGSQPIYMPSKPAQPNSSSQGPVARPTLFLLSPIHYFTYYISHNTATPPFLHSFILIPFLLYFLSYSFSPCIFILITLYLTAFLHYFSLLLHFYSIVVHCKSLECIFRFSCNFIAHIYFRRL